jgi:hypothetical protein
MYRCAHWMIKGLELRALELTPHFCSDAMPQYFEQIIRVKHVKLLIGHVELTPELKKSTPELNISKLNVSTPELIMATPELNMSSGHI